MTEILSPPDGLDKHARFAWERMVFSAPGDLLDTDVLALEAAARAWSRWKGLEERIAESSAGNVLAGEVAKGAGGALQISALRQAADAAWKSFQDICDQYGFTAPTPEAPVLDVDLFGYPSRPGRLEKGRPAFVATPADHNKVRLLLAMGWSNERVANAIEVSVPTLRKHFKKALQERDLMRERLDARMLELAAQSANDGNVSGLRELQKLIDKNDVMAIEERIARVDPALVANSPAKIGKKEERARDAEAAEARIAAEIAQEGRSNARH